MLHLALAGVRHNVGRYVATLVAIVTGVAFFAASTFVSARITDALEGDVDRQYGTVDAAVVPDDDGADDLSEAPVIPTDAASAIATAPGVDAVGGELTAPAAFGGDDGTAFATGATGRLWIADDELNPLDVTEGEAPGDAGDIAVDRGLADRESLAVGDDVTVLTAEGEFRATIVGLTEFGSSDALDDGGTISVPEAAAFDWLSAGRVEYQRLFLRGSADPDDIVDAVEGDVPPGFAAETGDQLRQDLRDQQGQAGAVIGTFLQAFALLALFVGGFVIYNTFSVIVAQRQRELAVLAAVGATPRQLKRSLRLEGLVIGLIGGTLGVVTGVALTLLLTALLDALGLSLAGGGLQVSASGVIQGILLGTIITLASVTIPARRAGRTEPIEALRDAATESATVTRARVIWSLGLVGLGLVGLFAGPSPVAVGLGAVLLVVGVIVAGPLVAVGAARLARPAGHRLGLEGQLAVDNSARNPKRTATTANALLIGVFLVTLVTVAGTSLKDWVVGDIHDLESVDFVVSSNGGTLDDEFLADLAAVDDVQDVLPFRREAVTLDGEPSILSTADLDRLPTVADIEAASGSLADLAPGTIAVADPGDAEGAVSVGDTVTIAAAGGQSVDLEVVALLDATLDEGQLGDITVAETFDQLVGDTAPTVAFVDTADGDQTDVEEGIDALADRRPDITVAKGDALADLVDSVFEFMINAVNGLLLMSVVVALIGIVNTLSLSILERRRELGLLRIIGMTDKRVQRMVRLESALIAALGTVTGVVLGLVTGWGLVLAASRLSDADVTFGFPVGHIVLVAVLGVVLGIAAAYVPARRSTRLQPLDAIQAT